MPATEGRDRIGYADTLSAASAGSLDATSPSTKINRAPSSRPPPASSPSANTLCFSARPVRATEAAVAGIRGWLEDPRPARASTDPRPPAHHRRPASRRSSCAATSDPPCWGKLLGDNHRPGAVQVRTPQLAHQGPELEINSCLGRNGRFCGVHKWPDLTCPQRRRIRLKAPRRGLKRRGTEEEKPCRQEWPRARRSPRKRS